MFLNAFNAFRRAEPIATKGIHSAFEYVYPPIRIRLPTHSNTFTHPFEYVYPPFKYFQ